ncbi:hypothetical protein F2P81_014507 [Scophthalmus maximus]|uniref:Uncharacterized protein n=1 Tax=Scophthalmus maximus TaxID=52904 RepID=A0A6A4SG25_SCOMX|nr:hypothetical protein F2P81_014507 [Scophthalmus maximus]
MSDKRKTKRVYYDPSHPGSLGGVERLCRALKDETGEKVDKARVKDFLSEEDTYMLHKPARIHFPRNSVFVPRPLNQFQADLCDMQALSKYNDGFNYLLIVIDVLTKKVKKLKVNFKRGDVVRISKVRGVFDKKYEHSFTEEVFTVHECVLLLPPVYRLKDYDGEPIKECNFSIRAAWPSQREGFYVNLPSKAGLSVFKNNTSSNYQTDLAQNVDLAELWEVALTEITYRHTWFNLPEDDAHFEWRRNNGEKHRQKIRGGYCDDLYQLQDELNSHPRELRTDVSYEGNFSSKFSSVLRRYKSRTLSALLLQRHMWVPLANQIAVLCHLPQIREKKKKKIRSQRKRTEEEHSQKRNILPHLPQQSDISACNRAIISKRRIRIKPVDDAKTYILSCTDKSGFMSRLVNSYKENFNQSDRNKCDILQSRQDSQSALLKYSTEVSSEVEAIAVVSA